MPSFTPASHPARDMGMMVKTSCFRIGVQSGRLDRSRLVPAFFVLSMAHLLRRDARGFRHPLVDVCSSVFDSVVALVIARATAFTAPELKGSEFYADIISCFLGGYVTWQVHSRNSTKIHNCPTSALVNLDFCSTHVRTEFLRQIRVAEDTMFVVIAKLSGTCTRRRGLRLYSCSPAYMQERYKSASVILQSISRLSTAPPAHPFARKEPCYRRELLQRNTIRKKIETIFSFYAFLAVIGTTCALAGASRSQ